jgi:hypothetical protein
LINLVGTTNWSVTLIRAAAIIIATEIVAVTLEVECVLSVHSRSESCQVLYVGGEDIVMWPL